MALPADTLASLRRQIAALEKPSNRQLVSPADGVVRLGCEAIDSVLPYGGLRRGAVHEVFGSSQKANPRGDGAAIGFVTAILAAMTDSDKHQGNTAVVWCMNNQMQYRRSGVSGRTYAPGLSASGLSMDRMLFVYGGNDRDCLWMAEEAVRSHATGAVVVELSTLRAMAARRLQLAAEAAGTMVLAVQSNDEPPTAVFTETCWQVETVPRQTYTKALDCWRLQLLRLHHGGLVERQWFVERQEDRLSARLWSEADDMTRMPKVIGA